MTKANPSTSNEEVIKFPPVVDIKFCSNLESTFTVKKMALLSSNLGGVGSIVIVDSNNRIKFTIEGSALKDSGENLILTVKPKGIMANLRQGIMADLHQGTMAKQWAASLKDGSKHLFTLKYSGSKKSIEVFLTNSKHCDYKIEEGSLEKDNFKISNMTGGMAAEVTLNNFVQDDQIIKIKSTYNVKVEPGYDQAFIFGLVAVLEQLRP